MKRVTVGHKYVFEPVGMDIWDHTGGLKRGDVVTVVNPHGCPPPGTMGHCYVNNPEGKFAGLVLLNSLQPYREK